MEMKMGHVGDGEHVREWSRWKMGTRGKWEHVGDEEQVGDGEQVGDEDIEEEWEQMGHGEEDGITGGY